MINPDDIVLFESGDWFFGDNYSSEYEKVDYQVIKFDSLRWHNIVNNSNDTRRLINGKRSFMKSFNLNDLNEKLECKHCNGHPNYCGCLQPFNHTDRHCQCGQCRHMEPIYED